MILDTTVLVDLDQGHKRVTKWAKNVQEQLIVPYQVAAEFLVYAKDRPAALARLKQAFTLQALTEEHIMAAAVLRANASRRVAWADVMIASHAVMQNDLVATSNEADFQAMGIRTVNPRVEAAK